MLTLHTHVCRQHHHQPYYTQGCKFILGGNQLSCLCYTYNNRLLSINNTKELIADSRKKEANTQICIYISGAEEAQVNSFRLYFQRKLKAKFQSQIPVNFYSVAWLETSQIGMVHKGSTAGDQTCPEHHQFPFTEHQGYRRRCLFE